MTGKYECAMVFSVANGEEATKALVEKFNTKFHITLVFRIKKIQI